MFPVAHGGRRTISPVIAHDGSGYRRRDRRIKTPPISLPLARNLFANRRHALVAVRLHRLGRNVGDYLEFRQNG
jgi:hypothetical protein